VASNAYCRRPNKRLQWTLPSSGSRRDRLPGETAANWGACPPIGPAGGWDGRASATPSPPRVVDFAPGRPSILGFHTTVGPPPKRDDGPNRLVWFPFSRNPRRSRSHRPCPTRVARSSGRHPGAVGRRCAGWTPQAGRRCRWPGWCCRYLRCPRGREQPRRQLQRRRGQQRELLVFPLPVLVQP
jgi:hypothetical protein